MWTSCIIWFLFVSICECWRLPDSEPVMYGEIQSPQYPLPYPPNLMKQWDLSVPEGYQIRLTFTNLDIEPSADCFYDALIVLHNENVLGKFCGQENSADGHHPGNQPILAPGNKLTLIFKTDDNNPELYQNVGFSAQYQAIDKDECSEPEPADGSGPLCSQICLNTLGSYLCSCHHGYELRSDQRTCVLSCSGGIFDEPEGHLSSPGYPNAPPYAVPCQYIISVDPGFTVTLNFTDNFHIESIETDQGPSCLHHWLQVTIPDKEPVKLCGNTSPGLIVTDSNRVKLDYFIDDEGLSNGWSLDYHTERVKCPFPGSINKGRVTPVLSEYFYRDYIYVRCYKGYKLMMGQQEIDSFTTMCESNGQWHRSLPECHIISCGDPKPLLNGGVNFLLGSENQYRSVVQYYCNEPYYTYLGNENVTFTCESDRMWRPNHNLIVTPTCKPVCGQPTQRISSFQRIIAGSTAPEGAIPWQVLLNIDGQRAGGIVIDDRWVLTAAHTLVHNGQQAQTDSVQIYMGHTDVWSLMGSQRSPASIYIHPGYSNTDNLNYDSDIALIKLQEPITFHSSVMPVCLPAEGATYIPGSMGLVSGFGVTYLEGRLLLTNTLKYLHLPVVNDDLCSTSIDLLKKTRSRIPSLTDNMFCAGVPEGGKDSCQGDSGGPFALENNGQFWVAGIVSWGVDCGQPGKYGVYTKVTNYVGWIRKTMQEN